MLANLSKHKYHVFAEYPIKSIAIFGSYAKKEQTEESDLDLIVEFNEQIGIRFIDLAEEI
ncbi:MAG: nucleotidyltransferase domain-containing protein [Bacteroidales bacterium]|nr:nucleotidyltransferase domain-containing protein [Bacteroidales bacterium]